jgi:hypothetical protein
MRIYAAVWLLAALAAFMGAAHSQQISDLYSSTESADATVQGDVAGYTLRLDLISKGDILQTMNIDLDGPGTWVARWAPFEAEEGSYSVCAGLWENNTAASRKCYEFYYGGPTPVRFDVRDFYADSKGMHLSVSARDPTIVDIYYMLFSGDKALYVSRDKAVPLGGGLGAPTQINYPWKQILEDNEKYTGRVKIVELNYNQTRAFMNTFVAQDDAEITETYEDETGASATVFGNSRVPFEGTLVFKLTQNGTALAVVEKKTPVLLTGDDETVEISWNQTLDPGVYQLSVVLLGNDGDVRDVEESIIEAEAISRPANNTTQEPQKSPLPVTAGLVALTMAAIIGVSRRRG